MESKTLGEIYGQYEALQKTLALMTEKRGPCREFFEKISPDRVIVVGCGSSYHLSQAVAMSAELHLDLDAVAVPGGDLMLHMDQYACLFKGRPLIIAISRSGSTSEVLYAIDMLKRTCPALAVLCVVCTTNSAIAARSDFTVEIPWAFDYSVCQTRSVTNLYAAAALVVAAAADDGKAFEDFGMVARMGNTYLADVEAAIKELGLSQFTAAAVLADGEGACVADEAALAFNEIAYTPSAFKHVLDVRHGPIVLFNSGTVAIIVANKDGFHYQKDLIADVLKRGARVVVVSDERLPKLNGVTAQICFGEKLHPMAGAILVLPVAQLIAYYHALAIHVDPDRPNGLNAWIKL